MREKCNKERKERGRGKGGRGKGSKKIAGERGTVGRRWKMNSRQLMLRSFRWEKGKEGKRRDERRKREGEKRIRREGHSGEEMENEQQTANVAVIQVRERKEEGDRKGERRKREGEKRMKEERANKLIEGERGTVRRR